MKWLKEKCKSAGCSNLKDATSSRYCEKHEAELREFYKHDHDGAVNNAVLDAWERNRQREEF